MRSPPIQTAQACWRGLVTEWSNDPRSRDFRHYRPGVRDGRITAGPRDANWRYPDEFLCAAAADNAHVRAGPRPILRHRLHHRGSTHDRDVIAAIGFRREHVVVMVGGSV